MKRALIERNLVVILFILVLVTFSFAERDSKKIQSIYAQMGETAAHVFLAQTATEKTETSN